VLTKNLAMGGAALLSITLVPVLMQVLVRGPHPASGPQYDNSADMALPVGARLATILIVLVVLAATVISLKRLGSEFMPTLKKAR
jgi:Cu(I)/Ag(I) efflux system membrane protein CusA/SilA